MTPTKAQKILDIYHENEDGNRHSENYLLLAESFEDTDAIYHATWNLSVVNANYRVLNQLAYRSNAHEYCNHYYYKLKDIVKKGLTFED